MTAKTTLSMAEEVADAFLAATLRDGLDLPVLTQAAAALVPARALHHGVTALVVARASALRALPEEAREAMRAQALGEAMWDLRHRQMLVPLLAALAEAGVPTVLLKGTALAYSLYPSPALRPRGDSDLMIPLDHRARARQVLQDSGYKLASPRDAERTTQEEWTASAQDGSSHAVDLHWELLWTWSLASLFDTTTLVERSMPCDALCREARRLPPDLALTHACLHRASHFTTGYFVGGTVQYGGDRLIWYYDMHLLAQTMTEADWQSFKRVTAETRTEALCRNALERCVALLSSPVPEDILRHLSQADHPSVAHDFFVRHSFLRRVVSDLRALPPHVSRAGFLKEIFLPSEQVMRAAFPELEHRSVLHLHLLRFRERARRVLIARRQRREP